MKCKQAQSALMPYSAFERASLRREIFVESESVVGGFHEDRAQVRLFWQRALSNAAIFLMIPKHALMVTCAADSFCVPGHRSCAWKRAK